ncbi:hypothetical protein AGMMS49992_02040 [Clostridia bacterium]|nr:hypothetical protein AGMMS49992_02040 [Clostridia bacterium]
MLRLIERAAPDAAQADLIQAGYSPPLARLLSLRGVETAAQAVTFLNPSVEQLRDPFEITGMAQAADLIEDAVLSGARILIFGDYDVDGVCAAALLSEALIRHGADVSVHIPDRRDEGYGLSIPTLERLLPDCDIIITVDCGVTAVAEAQWCKEHNLPLIITDHHEPLDELPDCAALVDPVIDAPKSTSPCGAGVAFKLVQALYGWGEASRALDLAALATIADLVQLLGENRVLAALGIDALRRTERVGLLALIDVAGLTGKPLNGGNVGFQLAPRLNAVGRVGNAAGNIRLLLTDDPVEARAMAEALNAENERRQIIQRATTDEADASMQATVDLRRDRLLMPHGLDWNPGIIGLVASAMADKYHLPAIVFSVAEKGGVMMATGSARSIPGVHIQHAMMTCQDLFTRFGGHSQAAGCTLPADRLPELRERLNAAIIEQADPDAFIPSERYDSPITLAELTMPFVEGLRALEPFGIGNPAPTFLLKDARVASTRRVGATNAHLRLRLTQNGAALDGIAFGHGERHGNMPERIDALIRGMINEWMGTRSVQAQVQTILPASPLDAFEAYCRASVRRFERELAERLSYIPDGPAPLEVYPLPQTVLRAQIADAVRADFQGVLMVARTMEAALDWADWLRWSGLSERVDCVTRITSDPHAFHTLAVMPELTRISARYDRVVFLDIPPTHAELDHINAVSPGALILLDEDAPDWEAAAATLVPTDEFLRKLYRALAKPIEEPVTLETFAFMYGVPASTICLALNVFKELGFISWVESPFDYTVFPPKKRKLIESALYLRMNALLTKYNDIDSIRTDTVSREVTG